VTDKNIFLGYRVIYSIDELVLPIRGSLLMQLEVEAHHRLWYHSIHGESAGWEKDTPDKKKEIRTIQMGCTKQI